jgi:lipopolysaccharide export system permease protein
VTKIDRYILVLFLRTTLICFCSIAGIFVVFHAFTNMDDLLRQGQQQGGLLAVMLRFYGPFMLLLFDMTGAITTLMAFLFTVGWLRRTGELTAILSAGISHGRILRPMVYASLIIILVQLANREFVLPHYRNALSGKAKNISGNKEERITPQMDYMNRVFLDGGGLIAKQKLIRDPSFRLDGNYTGFGDLLTAGTARWMEADENHGCGYLLKEVKFPEDIDAIPSLGLEDRMILLTRKDYPWLEPGQCFFATSVRTDFLQTNASAKTRASVAELMSRVRNPAVHNSLDLQVLLHERIVRVPLDFGLILLGLPIVINRNERNLFVMIGVAMFTVLGFFMVKTLGNAMGSNGLWFSPPMAAWFPLILVGPIAYVRYRDAQLV